MSWLVVPFALLALVGHAALWIGLFNRLHATALPCRAINLLEKPILVIVPAIPVMYVLRYVTHSGVSFLSGIAFEAGGLALAYAMLCTAIAIGFVPLWLWRQLTQRQPAALLSNDTTTIDIAQRLGHRPLGSLSMRLIARVPGNQILRLDVNEKHIVLPRLSGALDVLSIAHLSDLHFTGQLTRDYFDLIIDLTNELNADMIAVTGDIIDKPHCLDWIPKTLGRLRSRHGVYFVLGNHDKRLCDVPELRRVLTDAGLIDLGGRWLELNVRGEPIVLAGNELPWFFPAADMQHCPPRGDDGRPLRILLSHTPDQIDWAREFDFDLMLAGHTHGGQVRFPWIGPVVSPSYFGVKYAGGLFHEPPTLMHVTRGLSGLHPLRINCPPELTKLVLHNE
jgi:predicted MPP superfamily phosphohydrolase